MAHAGQVHVFNIRLPAPLPSSLCQEAGKHSMVSGQVWVANKLYRYSNMPQATNIMCMMQTLKLAVFACLLLPSTVTGSFTLRWVNFTHIIGFNQIIIIKSFGQLQQLFDCRYRESGKNTSHAHAHGYMQPAAAGMTKDAVHIQLSCYSRFP